MEHRTSGGRVRFDNFKGQLQRFHIDTCERTDAHCQGVNPRGVISLGVHQSDLKRLMHQADFVHDFSIRKP
jgi:hypothetical protein